LIRISDQAVGVLVPLRLYLLGHVLIQERPEFSGERLLSFVTDNRHRATVLRTNAACTVPGLCRSSTYRPWPVIIRSSSTRGIRCPTRRAAAE
jgi:hypothetical protein